MKRFVMNLFIFLVFLTGCSNDEAYNNAVKKGNDYITSEEYQKAETAFELALDEKMNDEQATALLTQTVSYQELIKQFNEGNFEVAIDNANEVIQIKNGSSNLVKKSEDVLEMIEVLEKTLAIETEKYEIALSHFDVNEYDKANTQIKDILTDNIEHPIFDSLNENIEKLSVDIESVLLAKQKEKEAKEAKEEKERKERKEREAEKKEKAESSITYEEESKAKNKEKSQSTYETEKKKNNGSDWKPRDEYEADMKKRNEEREKSRKAYDAEMKQRNADRDKRNRERNY